MIADPMADIAADPAAQQQQDGGGNTKEVFDPIIMQVNAQRIDRIHAVMGITSGCVAGIIGLTSLQGLRKFRNSGGNCAVCAVVRAILACRSKANDE